MIKLYIAIGYVSLGVVLLLAAIRTWRSWGRAKLGKWEGD